MSKKPYPGFPPNFTSVDETGGFTRTCFVLEFMSLGQLEPAQIALIEEQVSALAERLAKGMSVVEGVQFVTPDRFDRKLSDGLRLSSPE